MMIHSVVFVYTLPPLFSFQTWLLTPQHDAYIIDDDDDAALNASQGYLSGEELHGSLRLHQHRTWIARGIQGFAEVAGTVTT